MPSKQVNWFENALRAVVPTLIVALCAAAIKLYVDVAQLKAQNVTDARLTKLEARMDRAESDISKQWRRHNEEHPDSPLREGDR